MENASKALIIAGGILLGIITVSMLIYMYKKLGNVVDTISGDTTQEQLLEFNKGFEVYNKKIMYGTDIVSAINKAIDNNIINKVTAGDNSGISVNIIIRLNSDLHSTKTLLYKNKNYSLKENKQLIESVIIEGISYETESGTVENTSALFKRRMFKCISVKYDSKTGRICEMYFGEI